nr:hypothetical protein [Tanacetum cinerariifolium]
MLVHQGEGSGTPSEPHHTPFLEVETSHPTSSSIPLPSIPTTPIPSVTQPVTTPIIQYSRRARIAQSSTLLTIADEPASPVRYVNEGEACPTESGFKADRDRATIVNNDSKEIARVLTSMDAATVLAGGIDVPTEQIDAQVARELEEEQEKEDMRMNKQIARYAEVARIHAEEELQGMIDLGRSLGRS